MLVHTVYFWLREDLSSDEVEAFRKGLAELGKIASTEAVYVGQPAETPDRPVIDKTYSFGLTVLLKGIEQHDEYQDDPIHEHFVNTFKSFWTRVQIYDAA